MTRPPTDLDCIVARLDALAAENHALAWQNRRLKRAGTCAVLVVGILVLLTQRHASHAEDPKAKKVIEANEFVVKDEGGKTRAALAPGALMLHNEDGELRIALYANKKGGSGILLFTSNDQKQQISIMHTKEGLATFGINDKNGATRVMMGTRVDGKPLLLLQDANKKPFFGQAQP